jgi:hypothetical protein
MVHETSPTRRSIGVTQQVDLLVCGTRNYLAARLQGIAEPNRVVIAESTRRLLGTLFELEDLGSHSLKGLVGPVRAWAAIRPVESRFEALHGQGLTALVGREEEFEILLRRWQRAQQSCLTLHRARHLFIRQQIHISYLNLLERAGC